MSTDGVIHSIVTDGATAVLRVFPELPLAVLFHRGDVRRFTRDLRPTSPQPQRSASSECGHTTAPRGRIAGTRSTSTARSGSVTSRGGPGIEGTPPLHVQHEIPLQRWLGRLGRVVRMAASPVHRGLAGERTRWPRTAGEAFSTTRVTASSPRDQAPATPRRPRGWGRPLVPYRARVRARTWSRPRRVPPAATRPRHASATRGGGGAPASCDAPVGRRVVDDDDRDFHIARECAGGVTAAPTRRSRPTSEKP
jgi:hypothetical protein